MLFRSVGSDFELEKRVHVPSDELLRCKVVYDESGILDVQYFAYELKKPRTFRVVYDDEIEYQKKYMYRDFLDSLVCGSDEIIVVQDGLITDTSRANIAMYDNNEWLVTKKPLLFGTTMNRLLDEGFLRVANISVEMLKNAKKIAVMNAMVGFLQIEEFEILP